LQRICSLELHTAVVLNEELERILQIEVRVIQF
jgi:hypothetical protein